MNLTIDIGNTSSKYAIFNNSQIIISGIIPFDDTSFFNNLVKSYDIKATIISSVGLPLKEEIIELFNEHSVDIVHFTHKTKLPFKNNYKTPETIGLDRLASVAGALFLYPDEDLLVIDAGTAITYDFINSHKEYLGGNISPGLQMRFKALNQFTKKLPLLEPDIDSISLIGSTTTEAINNGVIKGLISEIDGIIDESESLFTRLRSKQCSSLIIGSLEKKCL